MIESYQMESGSIARILLLMIRPKRSEKSVLELMRMMSATFDLFILLFACEFVCKDTKKLRVRNEELGVFLTFVGKKNDYGER